jgi:CBS-domain-containing membrane protein
MSTLNRNMLHDTLSPKLKQQLVETKIRDVVPPFQNLVTIKSNESADLCLQRMLNDKITCLPLFDVGAHKYVGFIDMLDILQYVVEVLQMDVRSDETWVMSEQFKNTPAVMLRNRSQRNPWTVVPADASLQFAVNHLVNASAHRAAVCGPKGELVSIITQSAIVRYLGSSPLNAL